MWVKSAAGPEAAYPLEVDNYMVRIYETKRALPGTAARPGGDTGWRRGSNRNVVHAASGAWRAGCPLLTATTWWQSRFG